MAFADQAWYCNSVGYSAVSAFAASTAYTAGQLIRQLTTPTVGNERVFVVIVAGTSSTEPAWTLTRGAKTTSGGVTFQECTGASALNGDAVNTPNWTAQKAAGTLPLGAIIQRNSGTSYQICSTAGTLGTSEPAFSDTAGTTTTEGTTTWTSLGVVGNFTGGQAPHARLANAGASTWAAAGNTIYVGDNHAETQTTSIAIASTGTISTITKILCHNHSGPYPPTSVTTGASVTATTTGSITLGSSLTAMYFNGVAFKSGTSTSVSSIIIGGSAFGVSLENCSLQLLGTGATSTIQLGAGGAYTPTILNNTPVKFSATGQTINLSYGVHLWANTSPGLMAGSSVPSNLFNLNTNSATPALTVEGVDLSAVTGSLVSYVVSMGGSFVFKDCKLNASATAANAPTTGAVVQLVRSDSSTAYKSARYSYEGTETTESTIVRTGGATDPTGQAQSRKIVTTANAQWLRPFKAEPYAIWNPTTGSTVTVTVYGTVNSYYLPFSDEIWLEVEYLGASSSPLGSIVNTTKASVLAGNLPVAADTSVWSGVSLLTAGDEPSPRTTYMTFDGAPTSVTLSNGNLTVTHGNTSIAGVNSSDFGGPAVGQVGVKQYFEVTLQTSISNGNSIGYMTPSDSTTAAPAVGNNKTGVILGSTSSIIYTPNGVSTSKDLGAVAVNDVIGVAYDGDNSLLWFRKNGGNWNNDGSANPATGAGGVFATIRQGYTPYVAFIAGGPSTDVMKGNFGATTFANTPPSGFAAPDATGGGGGGGVAGWSSFKLVATLSSPQPQIAGYIHVRVRAAKAGATYYLDPKVVLS